ncbi:unnamed protein product, partial [Symbiodinium necroappetens]
IVHLESLCSYAALEIDRRADMLQTYMHKHMESGIRDGDFSTLSVEYYLLPNYGRRGTQFSGHNCLEVDTPCCHPRLLVMKLETCNLWNAGKFPMLKLFVERHKAWHSCLQEYTEVSAEDDKLELIRIFYGGKPSTEIPFLLKLCDGS